MQDKKHVGQIVLRGSTFDVAVGRDHRNRERHSINCPDWAVVAALTSDGGRLVMVKQFRYATQEASLESPGGAVDPGETAKEAAARELEEETGYRCEQLISLGWVHPNPAIQDNKFHMFLGTAASLVTKQRSDDAGRVVPVCMELSQVKKASRDGRMTHALHILLIERAAAAIEALYGVDGGQAWQFVT